MTVEIDVSSRCRTWRRDGEDWWSYVMGLISLRAVCSFNPFNLYIYMCKYRPVSEQSSGMMDSGVSCPRRRSRAFGILSSIGCFMSCTAMSYVCTAQTHLLSLFRCLELLQVKAKWRLRLNDIQCRSVSVSLDDVWMRKGVCNCLIRRQQEFLILAADSGNVNQKTGCSVEQSNKKV